MSEERDIQLRIANLAGQVGPVLKIGRQAAMELLRKATESELTGIAAAMLAERPEEKAQLLKSIIGPIYERTDPSRQSA